MAISCLLGRIVQEAAKLGSGTLEQGLNRLGGFSAPLGELPNRQTLDVFTLDQFAAIGRKLGQRSPHLAQLLGTQRRLIRYGPALDGASRLALSQVRIDGSLHGSPPKMERDLVPGNVPRCGSKRSADSIALSQTA